MNLATRKIAFIVPEGLQSWQCSAIKQCLAETSLEVAVVIECQGASSEHVGLLAKGHIAVDKALFSQYQSAVRGYCKKNLTVLMRKTRSELVVARSKRDLQALVELYADRGVTTFVDFTYSDLVDALLESFVDMVIWRLRFGISDAKCSDLVGYDEVLNRDTEIHISVTQSNTLAKNRIRKSACYKLFPASLSKTRSYLLWRGVGLLSGALKGSHTFGSQPMVSAKRRKLFTYATYVFSILGLAWKKKTKKSHWTLALSKSDMLPDSMRSFQEIAQPSDRFWADPFVVREGEQVYVFLEELEYSKGKGDIAYFAIDKDGAVGECRKLIEKDYHLSYPFVFQANGTYYMIPETSENRTIDLYRCTEFPSKWEFEKTLMRDLVAADTTLFYHDGRWWMFTTIDDGNRGSCDDELYLFYADTHSAEEWTSHPKNPIVRDVRSARMAGRVFRDARERIIRPSQDCSAYYGRGLNINEIEVLTVTEYKERRVNRIDAAVQENADGVHTYNNDSGVSIIDQFRWM